MTEIQSADFSALVSFWIIWFYRWFWDFNKGCEFMSNENEDRMKWDDGEEEEYKNSYVNDLNWKKRTGFNIVTAWQIQKIYGINLIDEMIHLLNDYWKLYFWCTVYNTIKNRKIHLYSSGSDTKYRLKTFLICT